MDGWSQLGANMFGNSNAAYDKGVGQGVDMGTKLARARQITQETMAKEQYRDALMSMGMPPEQAGGMAILLQGGTNPNNVSQARLGMQEFDQRGQIWDQASHPGATVAGLNPLLAALKGETVDTTKISGGVAYNPTTTPDMAQMMATPVGETQMLANQARANQSNAAAGAQAALARVRGAQADQGGFAPRSAAGGSTTFGRPQVTLMDRFLSNAEGDPDTGQQREFLIWQGRMADNDPRYRDPQFALSRFMEQADSGMGNFFDGSGAVPQRVDLSQGGGGGGASAPRVLPKGQYTEADAQELVAAAERAIAAGKDRKAVEDRLRQNLEAMGFTYGDQ